MPPEDRRFNERMSRFGVAVKQLISNEELSPEERLNGIFLLIDAHQLPNDPARKKIIEKCWKAYVADEEKKKRKKRQLRKKN